MAAAVAQTPTVDGLATTLSAGRYQRPTAALRLLGRAVRDAVGGRVGRPPLLVPLAGEPGTVSALTTPDGKQGPRALDPDYRYPPRGELIRRKGGHYAPFLDEHEKVVSAELEFLAAAPR